MYKRIGKWAWFWSKDKGITGRRLYGYVYNANLKSAQDCLDTFNAIHNENLTLKDVYITWDK